MNFLTETLLKTKDIDNIENNNSSPKIILIESPTGTGKTMMLLSSILDFLSKSKENKENDNINGEEDDWLNDFGKNKEKDSKEKIEEDQKKKINESINALIENLGFFK